MEIINKSDEVTLEIKKDSALGFVLVEPGHLTFKQSQKKNIKNIEIQAENGRSNVAVSLTDMSFPLQAEPQLIKSPKLLLKLSRPPQTISTRLQSRELIK